MATQELNLIVLDINLGATCHQEIKEDILQDCKYSLIQTIVSKIYTKPKSELSFYVIGSQDTNNALNLEMCQQGDTNQYTNIQELWPFQLPNTKHLQKIAQLQAGSGKSDIVDALIVIADCVTKAQNIRPSSKLIYKNVFLISSFTQQIQDVDEEFRKTITQRLQDLDVNLHVINLSYDVLSSSYKEANLQIVRHYQQQVSPQAFISHANNFVQLSSCLTYQIQSPRPLYQGSLSIGGIFDIEVRVYKKVAKESFPRLHTYSDLSQKPTASHDVKRDIEYFKQEKSRAKRQGNKKARVKNEEVDNKSLSSSANGDSKSQVLKDEQIMEEDQYIKEEQSQIKNEDYEDNAEDLENQIQVDINQCIKAYRLGSEYLPVTKAEIETNKYTAVKGFQIFGFVSRTFMYRQHFFKESNVVLPLNDEKQVQALSAIAQALHQTNKVALARYVPRANADASLVVLIPQVKNKIYKSLVIPDHFILNYIPYKEDMKAREFPSFQQDQFKASDRQIDCMKALMSSLSDSETYQNNLNEFGSNAKEILDIENCLQLQSMHFFVCSGYKAMGLEEQASVNMKDYTQKYKKFTSQENNFDIGQLISSFQTSFSKK